MKYIISDEELILDKNYWHDAMLKNKKFTLENDETLENKVRELIDDRYFITTKEKNGKSKIDITPMYIDDKNGKTKQVGYVATFDVYILGDTTTIEDWITIERLCDAF
jgi:hypothetical protein